MNIGVAFLVLAMLLTPAFDGVAKTLSAEHTPMMIAFMPSTVDCEIPYSSQRDALTNSFARPTVASHSS